VRQVSPGKQRASVQASDRPGRLSFSKHDGHNSDEHNSDGHGSGDHDPDDDGFDHGSGKPRTYPAAALWVVLVGGILLGLLFAGVISSFVSGSSDSTTSSGSGRTSTPSASTARQSESARTQERTESRQADGSPINRDVSILGCGTDAQGFASARVQITNNTAKSATYYVRVLFLKSADGRYVSDDVASVKRLPPGQTAPLQSVKAVSFSPGEQVTCTLGSVSRF
jgi:hypothetical protein